MKKFSFGSHSGDDGDMSVTVKVRLPDDLIPLLEQKARGAGVDREQYLSSIVSRDLTGSMRLVEILNGFRNQVLASGMSETELTDLFSAARTDASEPSSS